MRTCGWSIERFPEYINAGKPLEPVDNSDLVYLMRARRNDGRQRTIRVPFGSTTEPFLQFATFCLFQP